MEDVLFQPRMLLICLEVISCLIRLYIMLIRLRILVASISEKSDRPEGLPIFPSSWVALICDLSLVIKYRRYHAGLLSCLKRSLLNPCCKYYFS